jgi:hypothetical protein
MRLGVLYAQRERMRHPGTHWRELLRLGLKLAWTRAWLVGGNGEPVLQRVLSGTGFTRGGSRSGAALRVASVRLSFAIGGHFDPLDCPAGHS